MGEAAATCRTCGQALDAQGACIACGATFLAEDDVVPEPVKRGDSLVGREVIGQYLIRKRIGEGGMGAVYLADQRSVGRTAAIKVLHPQLSNAEVAERFGREARAASQLNHPNIVTIYNYGKMDDGTLFLAMEYLDGTSLQQLIDRTEGLQPQRAVGIASQIASALDEAHRAGIVHRDLKPQNVMLVERSQQQDFVKVLDFGIAKVQGVNVTADGMLCGTPRYMSPEQLRGGKIDGRSDLYSLGIVLFEMLAGRTPFDADSVLGFADKHLHTPPPSLSDIKRLEDVPPALEALVARLLAKDPSERPKSAALVIKELERVLEPHATIVMARPAPVERPLARRAVETAGMLWRLVLRWARATAALSRHAWQRLRRRSLLERVGLRRGPVARGTAWARKTWKSSRGWISRRLRR